MRSRERDANVGAVARATRTVAALAVLGTAVVGGLAAVRTRPHAPATGGSVAAPAAAVRSRPPVISRLPGDDDASPRAGSDDVRPVAHAGRARRARPLAAPPAPPAPAPVSQPPVAVSGGS